MAGSFFEIKMTTPIGDILDTYDADSETIKKLLVKIYCYVGEQCVKEARDHGSYKDQSGNLRSSIGYVVVEDGSIVQIAGLSQGPRGTDRMGGVTAGNSYLRKLAASVTRSGIVLIVCAGMNYAAYVENRYNKIVLSSAEAKAPYMVREILGKILGS